MSLSKYVYLVCFMVVFSACKESAPERPAQKTAEPSPPTAPARVAAQEQYPSVPLATVERLWKECDYIDYIWYAQNFSMNQNEINSIRGTVRHIAEEVPVIYEDCQPTGHIFFQSKGENILEADFYFSPGCTFFLFYEKGQKKYANLMTPEGLNFLQSILDKTQGG